MVADAVDFATLNDTHIAALTEIAGAANITTAQAELDLHNRDQSRHPMGNAQAVIYATNTEQVSAVMRYCY
jgi:FAD/FMN-containing dehydrogenase